jgi:hypothetical protein
MKRRDFCLTAIKVSLISLLPAACATATDPDDPTDVPQNLNVDVRYIRIEPWYIESAERVFLNWKYTDTQGAVEMPKIAENTHFISSVRIKTKTRITMGAEDWRKRGKVCKRFIICFTLKEVYREVELVFNGPEYGEVVFILNNNGTIEIVSPV